MVPDGVVQSGCAVTLAVGVVGGFGTAFTTNVVIAETQLVDMS